MRLLASRPTPNLEDQGIPFRLGPTCPARVALPVANTTAGIALRIIWPRKPSHPAVAFNKVEIPWRGNSELLPSIIHDCGHNERPKSYTTGLFHSFTLMNIWIGFEGNKHTASCHCTWLEGTTRWRRVVRRSVWSPRKITPPPPIPFYRGLCRPQRQSGHLEEKSLLPLPGFKSWNVHPVAQSLYSLHSPSSKAMKYCTWQSSQGIAHENCKWQYKTNVCVLKKKKVAILSTAKEMTWSPFSSYFSTLYKKVYR